MNAVALSLLDSMAKAAARRSIAEPNAEASRGAALSEGGSSPPPSGSDERAGAAIERCATESPHLALDLAEGLPLGVFGAVDYRWATSATLMDAMTNAEPLVKHLTGYAYALAITGDVARIHETTPAASPALAELAAALLVRRMRDVLGDGARVLGVRFTHALRGDIDRYRAFFGADVTFAAEANEVSFAAVLLLEPLLTADASMAKMLREHPVVLSHGLSSPDMFLERVRETIAAHLDQDSGELFVARVASQMKMSSRSLQRKLGERGVSFSSIVDDVLGKLAKARLAEGDATVAEVASRLGFRDLNSFHRAFRRWTGVTPRTFQNMRRMRESA